jgi:hypothetical protein
MATKRLIMVLRAFLWISAIKRIQISALQVNPRVVRDLQQAVERAAQRLLKCRRVGFQGKVTRFVAVTEAGKEFILPHPDLLQCIAEAADVLGQREVVVEDINNRAVHLVQRTMMTLKVHEAAARPGRAGQLRRLGCHLWEQRLLGAHERISHLTADSGARIRIVHQIDIVSIEGDDRRIRVVCEESLIGNTQRLYVITRHAPFKSAIPVGNALHQRVCRGLEIDDQGGSRELLSQNRVYALVHGELVAGKVEMSE